MIVPWRVLGSLDFFGAKSVLKFLPSTKKDQPIQAKKFRNTKPLGKSMNLPQKKTKIEPEQVPFGKIKGTSILRFRGMPSPACLPETLNEMFFETSVDKNKF